MNFYNKYIKYKNLYLKEKHGGNRDGEDLVTFTITKEWVDVTQSSNTNIEKLKDDIKKLYDISENIQIEKKTKDNIEKERKRYVNI